MPLRVAPPAWGGKTVVHSGRVAYGEMDEMVFGRPAPRWSWRPEQSLKHASGCPSYAAFLGVANDPS